MRIQIIKVLEDLQVLNLITDYEDVGDQVTFHTTGKKKYHGCPINSKVDQLLTNKFGDNVMWNDCYDYFNEGSVSY